MTNDQQVGKEKAETSSIGADTMSPFYLHASDNPGQLYVSELLNENNYGEWVSDMSNALYAKNKMGFVDGSIAMPEPNSANIGLWMRCNAMVKGWLKTAMSKEVRTSVRYAKTAREIWQDLEERFGKGSAPRFYELRREVALLKKERINVPSFYTRLKGFWDEMESLMPHPKCRCGGCTCGVQREISQMREREQLYDFLMGLDESFNTVRTQILSTTPMMSLGNAYHLVAEDEKQREVSMQRPTTESMAFQVQYSRNQRDQTDSRGSKKEKPRCEHCNKIGHTEEQCYEIIGYPPHWKRPTPRTSGRERKGGSWGDRSKGPRAAYVDADESPIPGLSMSQYEQVVKHFGKESALRDNEQSVQPNVNMAGRILINKPWFIDSGATNHITCDSELTKEGKIGAYKPVQIPNGEYVNVEETGSMKLPSGMKLSNVLKIPSFKCNLLSISKITREYNCAVTFTKDFCIMQDLHSRDLIGMGRHCDGLYILEQPLDDPRAFAVQKALNKDMWHKRLGHVSDKKISHLNLLPHGSSYSSIKPCDPCMKAKQTRLSFPKSSIKSLSPFDLVHCDIWGPYKTPSLCGSHYFLTVVDDYSRATWVYLMKTKSETSRFLLSFFNMVTTQFNRKVKQLRTDNGSEFKSRDMLQSYEERGILFQTSCTYTPQQNGVVERRHRHILEIARALRFHATLPIRFWGECVLSAVHLMNRVPSSALNHRTPYEVLTGKPPRYDHMRTFGCLAYYKDLTVQDKFAPRGRCGVFMGYPTGQKGYKVYDFEKRKIIVSRDVTFFENDFPFSLQREPATTFSTALKKQDMFVDDDEGHLEPSTTVPESPASQHDPPLHEISNPDEPVNPQPSSPGVIIRKSTRPRELSSRLHGYEVKLPNSIAPSQSNPSTGHSEVHSLSHFVSYDNFSPSHKAFLTALTAENEPRSFAEAVKHDCWRQAMKNEVDALERNGTWTLEQLPSGKKAIDSKWVYKTKFKPNGELERYKARLVAKGYTQVEGVDYHETFAPVAKLVTVRTLLAVAAKRGWDMHQLDVNNAFLQGELEEEVYMKIPQGFSKKGETRVCRLRKSLYGLKQASRNWYQKLTSVLMQTGFRQSRADHSLLFHKTKHSYVAILIYVDDIIITGNDADKIAELKQYLHNHFSIKDLGPLKYFLGIEVARTRAGLVLSQRKYALDILKDARMEHCRPSSTPMDENCNLMPPDGDEEVDAGRYRRLIGRLLYLTVTRPDLVYPVNVLSQHSSRPTRTHMDAVEHVLRYLKGSAGQGILLRNTGICELVAYCDADWGRCKSTRRSCTGYYITLGGSPISWRTKKQSVVARSSAEAEYRSMASTVSEVIWLRYLLHELGETQAKATPLFCDNQAALHIAANPVFHERTKHVEMDCYFVRERVQSHEVKPRKISTTAQLADIFTKPLRKDLFQTIMGKLSVVNLHAST